MQEFKLERDGNSDIKFSGWKIGRGNSRNGDYRFSHQVNIYRTKGGKFIGEVSYSPSSFASAPQEEWDLQEEEGGDRDESTVYVADTIEKLKQQFLQHPFAHSKSYRTALREALGDDYFVEQVD